MTTQNQNFYENATEFLKGMAHPIRLGIVSLLSKGEKNVLELYSTLNIPQSTTSQHLIKMKAAGIVTSQRKGLECYYRLKDEKFAIVEADEEGAEMIKAMAHPVRLEIATILKEGEANVTTLQEKLGIAQSTTSIHLGKLKNSGVLKSRRKGLEMFYSVKDSDNISAILSIISE
ncbi:hypothetical protein bcgnr5369_01840 [Bacillus cereus]